MTPHPYAIILLALAAYRTWRLLAADDITAPLRRRILGASDAERAQWAHVIENLRGIDVDVWKDHPELHDRVAPGPDGERLSREEHATLIATTRLGDFLLLATGRADVPPLISYAVAERRCWRPPFSRAQWWAATLVRCAYCLGAWISLAWIIAWLLAPHGTLLVASVFAISALVGIIASAASD